MPRTLYAGVALLICGCSRDASSPRGPAAHPPASRVPAVPASVPAATPAPLRVGGDVLPPVEIYRPAIRFTDLPKQYTLGLCILEIVVDEKGAVTVTRVLRPDPVPPACRGWVEQAIRGATAWRYGPASYRGTPVPVYMTITVTHFPCQD